MCLSQFIYVCDGHKIKAHLYNVTMWRVYDSRILPHLTYIHYNLAIFSTTPKKHSAKHPTQ